MPRAGQARERRGRRRPGGRARARAARRAAAGRAARNAEAETRPKGAAGLRRHRRPPKQPPTLNRRLSSPPVKPAIAGGSQGGSGGRRGCAGGVGAERGIRARARGVGGNLPGRCAAKRSAHRSAARSAAKGLRGKAQVRERGDGGGTRGSSAVFRRDRPEVPEPPRRPYPGSSVAPRLALRRESEGCGNDDPTPACPPLSAAIAARGQAHGAEGLGDAA